MWTARLDVLSSTSWRLASVYITLRKSGYLQTKWKITTTTEMHKIAQKSYCARLVLSLATIRNKCYFDFMLNRNRLDRELF